MKWLCKIFGCKPGVIKGNSYRCPRCGMRLIYMHKLPKDYRTP